MAAYGSNAGYSGSSFDRWVGEQSLNHGADNTINKMQHQFWVAKQTILRRIGKKEDECIIASDAELDAKLELFLSIQETCSQLHKVIEHYQERLYVLSQEEYSFGYFLRNNGELDKTKAGKMMVSVGKSLIYTSQQRGNMKAPLTRLHQEVETFCQRAIEDTSFTVNEMEKSRNDYRGALLWMKDVSQVLDPDTFKQLEKFRRIQGHVRGSKTKFDRHKLACLQKVDLLAAARCNMFSHGLIVYQENLTSFWKRTSNAYQAVSDAYKGYQPYEFTFVKGLTESSLKLAGENKPKSPEPQFDFLLETEFHDEKKAKVEPVQEIPNRTAKELKAKGKSKIKDNKSDQLKAATKVDGHDDLLGLDLETNAGETDALLVELNSLDLGGACNIPADFLNFQSSHDESFQADFDQVFGTEKTGAGNEKWNSFLPSQLLTNKNLLDDNELSLFSLPKPSASAAIDPVSVERKVEKQQEKGKDMISWYNLFADLDPLANPDDLIPVDKKGNNDRNC